jgi:hypothetical protein
MKKLLFTMLFFALIFLSQAAIITVTNTNDAGPGSLRLALTNAASGDTINFSITGVITLTTGEIVLSQDVSILGPGSGSLSISGNNASRVFRITGGIITIADLTLTNGHSSDHGGAIENDGNGTVSLNRCMFTSCSVPYDGGAIRTTAGTLNINSCTFSGNHADFDGGGIRIEDGTVLISKSTFTGNTTGMSGAGIRIIDGAVTIVNTTLSGNAANYNGGGFEGLATIINCTITNNSASNGGGAKPANSSFVNCIVYNNTATGAGPDLDGSITSNGFNIIGNSSGSGGFITTDMIGVNPLLNALANNGGYTFTHSLDNNSPAINAGTTCCNAPSVDQRDSVRNCNPDIGAYESNIQASSSSSVSITACGSSYTSPSGNYTWTSTGIYMDTISNALGCDSVITLSLTLNTVNTSVTTNGVTITAVAAGASYQWLDCNNGFAIMTGDTNQSFTATVNGDYAVEVTENACTDTSVCTSIQSVGLVENALFNGVSIFPNPNNGIVKIDLGGLTNVSVKLYTADGKVLFQKDNLSGNIDQFEINSAPGFYFLELRTQGYSQHYKLVKE